MKDIHPWDNQISCQSRKLHPVKQVLLSEMCCPEYVSNVGKLVNNVHLRKGQSMET